MVIDVSAMLVASTTLRTPGGIRSKTSDCSAGESDEWSGSTRKRLWSPKRREAVSVASRLVMSEKPGKKTSTAPSSPVSSM